MPIRASLSALRASALPFLLLVCAATPPAECAAAPGLLRAACTAPDDVVPRQETAEAQLKLASELRSALRGREGAERETARTRAVAACRAVRQYFPTETAPCAEAAFRAGELLRAAGDLEAAGAEFALARDTGGSSPFRLRALLELGHLQRRGRAFEKALASYEALIADRAATPGQRDEASLWAGAATHELGRAADARRIWQRVADGAEDPLDRVRAWDRLASALIESGDLEGAAGTLERCKEALASSAAEETRLGERVRSALDGMRAADELPRAIERRRAGDAGARTHRNGSSKSRGDDAKKGPSGDENPPGQASEVFPSRP